MLNNSDDSFCLFTQTDQAMPIVMKTRDVFPRVQLFLKKQANTFMGQSLISGLECKEGLDFKHYMSRSLVKANIWPVG